MEKKIKECLMEIREELDIIKAKISKLGPMDYYKNKNLSNYGRGLLRSIHLIEKNAGFPLTTPYAKDEKLFEKKPFASNSQAA